MIDPRDRFTGRVADYIRNRPGYPPEIIAWLRQQDCLGPGDIIADVGAGTGKLCELFLHAGHAVVGVEPNAAMRAAATGLLGTHPGFTAVDGSAEATSLPAASVHLVTAGQAFHWFDAAAARSEFQRILVPGGGVCLLWNVRSPDRTPFMADYENLLRAHGTDYLQVQARVPGEAAVQRFFAPGPCASHALLWHQVLDREGLRGRLLSSSYVPAAGTPAAAAMLVDLDRIFSHHQQQGQVQLAYDSRIHLGHLG